MYDTQYPRTAPRDSIRYFGNEKETGAEMCPALLSAIVTEVAPVSRAIGQFSPVAGNSQNSLGKLTRPSLPRV